ncbi:MAG: hypothetical protein IGS03_05010 [Candidatus Sericytochromatia bacterium]|nr:hypothetical protein [Candidatus Sericytochromatia bacterium]
MLFLPASDGFAPNINVQTQFFEGDLAAYAALSRQQFAELELELLAEEISPHQITWSYQGLWQGIPLRWYSRAIFDAEARKAFLMTGTALQSQWPQVAPSIKRCVESLELLPSERSER